MESLKEIIESILFVAGEPVTYVDIAEKLQIETKEVEKACKDLQKDKEKSHSGIQLQNFNGKAQLCSNSNYAEQVAAVLNPIKEKALTKAVMEVAGIIAYKQPITRLEIENVRGVNSDYAVNMLIENKLIEIAGRKDAIGKPLLYSTTDEFLKRFGLSSLEDLPDYEELLDRIKVIKTPESSLFDFSNIPSTEMTEDLQALREEAKKSAVLEKLEAINDIEIIEDLSDSAIEGFLNNSEESKSTVLKTEELEAFAKALAMEDDEFDEEDEEEFA